MRVKVEAIAANLGLELSEYALHWVISNLAWASRSDEPIELTIEGLVWEAMMLEGDARWDTIF